LRVALTFRAEDFVAWFRYEKRSDPHNALSTPKIIRRSLI
jgi:hypothetical protein